MALIKCHECGNRVSTEAKTCPTCGATVRISTQSKAPVKSTRWGWILIILFIVLAALKAEFANEHGLVGGEKTPAQRTSEGDKTTEAQKTPPVSVECGKISGFKSEAEYQYMGQGWGGGDTYDVNLTYIGKKPSAKQLDTALKDCLAFAVKKDSRKDILATAYYRKREGAAPLDDDVLKTSVYTSPKTPVEVEKLKARDEKDKRNVRMSFAALGATQLKNSSKDPDSFQLKSLYLAPDGTACYTYRAKNSFNALLEGEAVKPTKGRMLIEEHDGDNFVNAWNKSCTKSGGEEIAYLVKMSGVYTDGPNK